MKLLIFTQAVDLDHPVLGFFHQWINQLASYFEHIHVITPLGGRTSLVENVTLHAFASPEQPDNPLKRHRFFQQKLATLILGGQVDRVFIHMIPKWVALTYPYAQLRRLPITLWYTHSAVNARLRLAHRLVTRVMTASKESYRLAGEHVYVMGHGIDTEWFKPVEGGGENGRFHLMMPGRVSSTKQPHLLINAIRDLPDPLKQSLSCHIIGRPHNPDDELYQAQLQQQIKAQRLEKIVKLVGPIPYTEMVHPYQQADLVINLSRTNSLDKTVLEAMACGVPVLTSNPACHPFLNKIDPRLTLRHDDEIGLKQNLAYWISRPHNERQQIGKQLREEVIQHHNMDALMKKMAALLQQDQRYWRG